MIINHKGKTMDSISFDGTIDKSIVSQIRNGYYNEDKELALKQLKQVLLEGKSKSNHIYSYYFERVANDTVVDVDKWSINEVLESDELIQLFYNRTKRNEKMYPDQSKIIPNFKTAIRLGGKGICRKPTQFPIKVMRSLLDEFTQGGDVYYDPCMGWGMRLMCAAEKGLRYIGNDVNKDLVIKLNELRKDINTIKPFSSNLILQGSEIHLPALDNKVDFIFTSPPYFDLEQYNGANLEDSNYNDWLEQFMKPMLLNCYRYIKKDKYVLINIKNTKKYNMYDDTLSIAKEIGFEFIGEKDLKQTNRTHMITKHGDSSEKIMVLKKVNI